MEKEVLIKNISFCEPHILENLVTYEEGRVVSRTLAQNKGVSITLFAFDKKEGLSTHSAPGDAMAQILDGQARIVIDGKEFIADKGGVIVMPADIPHAVYADQPFKMILTVVKKAKNKNEQKAAA